MKKLMLGLFVFGLATQFMYSQNVELPEVHLDTNYKYLDAIASEQTPERVKNLEKEVAFYDLKASSVYNDPNDSYGNVYGTYRISFIIPEGKIQATFDKDGKITRTIERFTNVIPPRSVIEAVGQNYPNWEVVQDWYKANYFDNRGITLKQFKIKLKKDDETMTVKIDENGEYL